MKAKKMIKKELEKNTDARTDRVAALPAMTVVGKAIAGDANMMFPQSTIDSIAHTVSSAVGSGTATAAASGVAVHSGAAAVIGQKVIIAVVTVVIAVTGTILVVTHQNSDKPASDTPNQTAAVTPPPVTEEAPPTDLKVAFIEGECDCGHLNPKNAELSGSPIDGFKTTWQIIKSEGDVIATGEGTDVAATLQALFAEKNDGTYKLAYEVSSENGHKVNIGREFVIDTGDLTYKNYK
jgi:hypothetical protein